MLRNLGYFIMLMVSGTGFLNFLPDWKHNTSLIAR